MASRPNNNKHDEHSVEVSNQVVVDERTKAERLVPFVKIKSKFLIFFWLLFPMECWSNESESVNFNGNFLAFIQFNFVSDTRRGVPLLYLYGKIA